MPAQPQGPSSLGRLLLALPQRLSERAVIVAGAEVAADASWVLYWCHHAMRADENPALDAAGELALRLGKPLLVFGGLAGSHPHLSDRHAAFIIEGYRDLSRQLAAIGVPFACSLDTARRPDAMLDVLATRAALVVTEDFPAAPFPEWTASLARRTGRPIVAVDTACLVPMNRVDGVFDRAFAFREATAGERAARVGAAWPTMAWRGRAWPLLEHGVPDIDWARLDLAETLASLDIDHGVAPVADTKGGTAAGQARWNAFRAQRLARYAEDRDDATIPGVSRMSAYLHYGMVSPMRLAREAHAVGAEKYLDELLVWRELAYHWCRHVPEHATLHALPSWARRTLDAHRGDPRAVLSAERLSRGETGDRLWDLAQRSLVVHGELHNNLRMTWGKAVPFWSASPEQALERTLWLNNRFALDGCDPASYGGILWCLGLFDRAFLPERPVLGSVRERTTEEHARRLDTEAYARIAERRPFPMRVAVIGAGIAGLACARTLRDHLVETVVFEKSRGAGGRMSTRRGDHGAFDHGAQYFTARDPRFASVVSSWCDEGVVARWHARFANVSAAGALPVDAPPRFVGVPSMSAVGAHLARGGECVANTRVTRVEREGVRWRLHGIDADGVERDLGSFDAVLSTAPAPQTAALLSRAAPRLAQYASRCGMRATWALMLAFRDEVAMPFDHAEISAGAPSVGDALAWVSCTSAKPGRAHDGIARWTVLARSEWSEERLERTPEEIAPMMVDAFERLAAQLGVRVAAPMHAQTHRWRFALAGGEGGPASAYDASIGVGMAGDWMRGTRVEDAYLSGISLAGRVLATAAQRFAPPASVAVAVARG